ncbi:acyl-CoA dehydrogenase family protein [Sneathiella litorea]|uniref:Acyl-CoA dehydrogenase n=1 Tax=Sneathiella litorea TaxID=2606216 RepID=A0A6L8WB81_9PROT|nr:acyl-CoA dehydrogenase family protein [Sneathiella litorea]MZR31693.1 hypothetical protein [Sneathiella litorea]
MTPADNPKMQALSKIHHFATTKIKSRRAELIAAKVFPEELWHDFANSGLASLSLPEEYGGLAADYSTLSLAGRTLNQVGGVPGVTMVFMAHWLMSKLHIAGDAPSALKQQLLPELAKGETTLSVAISEPGAGAHPKLLKTTARREGEEYILNGEKAFLTNGPIANHFIVLAITDEANGKKAFSAILVSADSEGFRRTEGVKIDFLHPCPHGGIILENCRVPIANLIGKEGDALNRTSLRMRAIEDATGAGSQVGSMYCLLSDVATHATEIQALKIGAIATRLKALDVIAAHLASMANTTGDDLQPLLELQLGFHQECKACADALEEVLEELAISDQPQISLLVRDISKSLTIARNAHTIRLTKIGRTIINNPANL